MRIASLLPSATEIVYSLGLGDQLVGVTFECDYPPSARRDHPIVVGGADTQHLDPATIDQMVHDTLAESGNLYTLELSALSASSPDVILTQDLCRVCAVPSGQVDAALASIGCRSQVVSLDPMTLDDVLLSIIEVADACGVPQRGHELVAGLRARVEAVRAAVAGRVRPRVFVLEWVDPPFLCGHWVPDLIAAAGGDAVLCTPGDRSHETTFEAIADADPDFVLVAPCGFGSDAASAQALTVLDRLPGREVWALDGNAYIVRPSARLVDGIEIIAAILHPGCGTEPTPEQARRLRG